MALAGPAPIEERPLRLESRPEPEPGPGELLVRVDACAICRTDLHIVEGDLPLARSPIVPGHQIVGRVVGGGPGATRFERGRRVGIAWLRRTCRHCELCGSGRENLCERAEFTGYHADGGFAEYAVAPEDFAYALPDTFTDAQAAPLLCAGIIGYRALKLAAVPAGGRLGLFGFGSSAHVTLQLARARGCEVFVCTRGAARRELARALGAVWAGDVSDRPPASLDGAIVFAPAGEIVPRALASVARGATVALAGIYMTALPPLDYARHLAQERVLRSVTANTRADGEEFLAAAARVAIRPQVTPFPLSEANTALLRLARGDLEGSGVLLTALASGL
jgi:propanol-preferring alcohol dehydrogenase